MKKEIILILISFIALIPLCQEVAKFDLVDEYTEFDYKLDSIMKSGTSFTAMIIDRVRNRRIEVREGDKLPGVDLTDAEIETLRNIAVKDEREKFRQDIYKQITQPIKEKGLKSPRWDDLYLSTVVDSHKPSEDKFRKLLDFVLVKEITEKHLILEDTYRGGQWKLFAPREQKVLISSTLKYQDVKVPLKEGHVLIDAKKEASYSQDINIGDYSISMCHDNKDIYFYIEYYCTSPLHKYDNIFVLKFNEEKQEHFYDIFETENFLELIFLFFREKDIKDFLATTESRADFDMWTWNYTLRKNRYIYDMTGYFSREKDEARGFDRVELESTGALRYLYIKEDSGNPINEDNYVTPNKFIGNVVIPGHPNLSADGSQIDVTGFSRFEDDPDSPYITGKIIVEFKRPFKTGNPDDIDIDKNGSYIIKPVDFSNGRNLDLSKSIRLQF